MTKGQETRQRIIELAAPIFNQRGFAGCSMADIMAATGLEKGGIYRYFSSKSEIYILLRCPVVLALRPFTRRITWSRLDPRVAARVIHRYHKRKVLSF